MRLYDYLNMIPKDADAIADLSKEEILAEYGKLYKLCTYLDTIIEHSSDSLFITDGDANIVKLNAAYEILGGVKREDLLQKNMRQVEGVNVSKSCTLMVLETKRQVTIEQTLLGTNRHCLVTTTPIFDDNGNIIMTISNDRDFAEIETLKERLADTEDMIQRYKQQIEAIRAQTSQSDFMVAHDKKMLDVLYRADKISKVDANVLILGETGAGKEQLVRYLHNASSRSDEALIKINCSVLPANLIESELFGYEKGAFTGASNTGKTGFFEAADKGTIFLDEIGEVPLEIQAKLLRVLQEGEFYRIGGTVPIKTNVRVYAATNRNLQDMIQKGLFRPDLYFRLNVTSITIPPLRERAFDIIPLAMKFLGEFNEKYGMTKSFSVSAFKVLQKYEWPGNVRELRNVVEQALIMSEGDLIQAEELPLTPPSNFGLTQLAEDVNLEELVGRFEASYIKAAYEKHGNVRAAAKSLGLNTTTYARKKRKYT